jgi:hypothetical protein
MKVTVRQGKQAAHGEATQFSEYGMLLSPAEIAQVGQRYDLQFSLPGQRGSYNVRGVGVYATVTGIGIRFEHVPADVTTALRQYISMVADSAAQG